MQLRKKQGAYFFVLDAFIAGLIIIATLAISLSSTSIQDDPLQESLLAHDFLTFLEQTTLAQYGEESVYLMIEQGLITDTSYTLLEAIVLLNATGTPDARNNLTALLSEVSVIMPAQLGIGYYITTNGVSGKLYSQSSAGVLEDDARSLLLAQRIVPLRNSPLNLAIVEVRVWR